MPFLVAKESEVLVRVCRALWQQLSAYNSSFHIPRDLPGDARDRALVTWKAGGICYVFKGNRPSLLWLDLKRGNKAAPSVLTKRAPGQRQCTASPCSKQPGPGNASA